MEFFLHVDDAGVLVAEQLVAHPFHFAARESGRGDVDGGASEVGANDVALGVGGVVVGPHQPLLILDGTDGRADDEGRMKLSLMSVREVGQEISGPGAAIATVLRQSGIHGESGRLRDAHKQAVSNAVLQVGVVFNTLEVLFF